MINKNLEDEVLVSIVCITYNHVKYIEKTLDSLLGQKFKQKFEILLYDDCSTDGTTDIVKLYANKYPKVIKPIINNENKYSLDRHFSWELCFSRAKGKYISICEGDDYWVDSEKLKKQYQIMEMDSNITLCYSNAFIHFDNDTNYSVKKVGRPFKNYEMYYRNPIPTLTVMFRKSSALGFWDSVKNKKVEWIQSDYQLWLWLMNKGQVKYLNQPLAAYRVLRGSASRPTDIAHQYRYRKSIIGVSEFFAERFLDKEIKDKVLFRIHCFAFFWCYLRGLKEMDEHKFIAIDSANSVEKVLFKIFTTSPLLSLVKIFVTKFWWRK